MRVPVKIGLVCAAIWLSASGAFADEIRLKDGKKLYGVIVAYEDGMFKVKTDFGFVLVEKDKIASIIPDTKGPTTPASGTPAASAKPAASKPAKSNDAKAGSEIATPRAATSAAANSAPADSAPAKAKVSGDPVRPSLPATASTGKVTPPAIKSDTGGTA